MLVGFFSARDGKALKFLLQVGHLRLLRVELLKALQWVVPDGIGFFKSSRLLCCQLCRPEVELLVIVPLTFFDVSAGVDDKALALLLAIVPLPLLRLTIAEEDAALAVQLVV